MAERKAVNKYIPPTYDPEDPRPRAPTFDMPHPEPRSRPLRSVRLMLPFSARCSTCGEHIPKGRKFNARKETCWNETYLGVQIFRFYVRCTLCAAEISFRTDPKNADYELEQGATRNAEPWRSEQRETEAKRIKREMEEANDPMKKLENRTIDSKKEIDIAETLEELRTIKSRLEKVDRDVLLRQLEAEAEYERGMKAKGIELVYTRNEREIELELEQAKNKIINDDVQVEEEYVLTAEDLLNIKGADEEEALTLPNKKTRLAERQAALGIQIKKKKP